MRNIFTLFIAASSLLVGCTTPALQDTNLIRQSAQEAALSTDVDAAKIIAQAKSNITDAYTQHLDLYSPSYLEQAEKEIQQSQKAFDKSLGESVVTTHALTAQKLIERAYENKQQVESILADAFNAFFELKNIKSATILPDDHTKLRHQLADLARLIERSEIKEAKAEQSTFLEAVAEFEILTLKATYLNPVDSSLKEAKAVHADDFAESTYQAAHSQRTELNTLIQSQPKAIEDINAQMQIALRAAQRTKHVAIAVKPLLSLNPEKAEAYVLSVESLLARIGKALNQEDVRHLPLDSQSIAITQNAELATKRAKNVERQENLKTENTQLKMALEEAQAALDLLKNRVKPTLPETATNGSLD